MHFALLVDHWLFRVLAIAALVLEVWALVDVVRRRPDDFARIGGRDRSFWLILTGVAAVVGLLGVLAGAANPAGGRAFVEWMLSKKVQSAIPDSMYMYPVNPDATLSDAMKKFGATSDDPIVVKADDITKNRESWLQTWTEAVGQ